MSAGTTKFIEALRIVMREDAKSMRTVVPGKVGNVTRQGSREQDADFVGGVAELVAGEADAGTPSPDAPRLQLMGGGAFILLPVSAGDEGLGLVSDRALDEYRQSREPGLAPVFERVKDDSDTLIAPLGITAPPGAPDTWDGIVMGVATGPAIEVAADGTVTITGQATAPATPTTIVMEPGGDITFTVGSSNSVNVGGAGATALALGQKVIDAIDAAWAAATPVANDGGASLKSTWLEAWNPVKNAINALRAKGI